MVSLVGGGLVTWGAYRLCKWYRSGDSPEPEFSNWLRVNDCEASLRMIDDFLKSNLRAHAEVRVLHRECQRQLLAINAHHRWKTKRYVRYFWWYGEKDMEVSFKQTYNILLRRLQLAQVLISRQE